LVLGAGLPAQAFVPWDNSSGETDFFSWAGGGSDNGLFGDPVIVGQDTFVFFPQDFIATSVDGVSDLVSDRLEVELTAKPDFRFSGIRIQEFGDYGIDGSGAVSVSGGLFITDIGGFFRVESDELTSTPGSPITSGAGDWEANAFVDLDAAPPDWTHIQLVLDNVLSALSDAGSTSFIEKKVAGAGIMITIVPGPGSVTILALGGLPLLTRRRR